MIPISVLDLVPVGEGLDIKQSFKNSISLAQIAEKEKYHRIWYAEHHGMPGVASVATSILITNTLNHTQSIRVGSGGIMLPNHSPLVIAEQFGTLSHMHENRIDLGLGRAPGTDLRTAKALRRKKNQEDTFSEDVIEILRYFQEPIDGAILAVPAVNTHVPVWILGSSHYSAYLAAYLGLPYVFASHFSSDAINESLMIYRNHFKPSQYLDKPYVMLAINVVLADTQEEADFLYTSILQIHLNLSRGTSSYVPKPVNNMDTLWNEIEKRNVNSRLKFSFVGTTESIKPAIKYFIQQYNPNELIITQNLHDHLARENTLKLFKQIEL